MEHLLQENLPKLLPLWHDLSVQNIVQIKSNRRFFQDRLPDFGGTGIDISNKNSDDVKCYSVKHGRDEITFRAAVCSLPFFPPNKVSLKSDPCLMLMNTSKAELKRFCVALDHLRKCANKSDGKFKKELRSSYKIAKNKYRKNSKEKFKFSVPDTIIHLATQFPRSDKLPEANFDYLGGCLASSQTINGSHILLHPVGKKLNKLGVTPLEEMCYPNQYFQPVYSEMNTMKMKKDCIQKIRSAFPGHCFVQQGKFCQYVNFTNLSNIFTGEVFRKRGSFVNMEASPYNPMELISIDEKGMLELHDIDTRQTLWRSSERYKTLRIAKLKACTFGSHPKSVLSLVEHSVHAHDLRLDKKTRSVIFSQHFSSFPEETLLNIKSLSVINPFQHLISTTRHVYICDERYPKKPVLMWSHLLKSFPLYCDVACYNLKDSPSDAVALLGSQESRELSLFTMRSQESQIQPISLNTPMLLSSPSDFTGSLRLHGIHVNDDLIERIMNPLIGVCTIPHSKKVGFTAFQLSSFGDVFYQDFDADSPNDAEHTYRVDTGCTLTPPEIILPHLSKWTDFFSKSSKKTHFSRSNLVSVNVDLKDILSNSPDISSGCDLCNSNANSCDRELLSTRYCSFCGLDSVQVKKTLDAFSNLGLLAGAVKENTDLDNFDNASLSDFKDEYSIGILKPWSNSEDVCSASPPIWDLDSDVSRLSFDSSKSGTSHSTVVRNLNFSLNTTQCSDIESQPSFHNALLQDETMSDYQFASQDTYEEFVPPSQDIRPIIGETLRTPRKPKTQITNTSFAGF